MLTRKLLVEVPSWGAYFIGEIIEWAAPYSVVAIKDILVMTTLETVWEMMLVTHVE